MLTPDTDVKELAIILDQKKTVPSPILFVRFGFEAMARTEWSVDIPSFVVAMHMQVVIVGAKFVLGECTLRYAC